MYINIKHKIKTVVREKYLRIFKVNLYFKSDARYNFLNIFIILILTVYDIRQQ